MFGKKRKQAKEAAQQEATAGKELEVAAAEETEQDLDSKAAPEDRATAGPYDVTEVPAIRPYVDLGSIKVAPREGLGLRLDVNETNGEIIAVSLDLAESTLQVQAFAAQKTKGIWHTTRAELLSTLLEAGAPVTEEDGTFGKELKITDPEGEKNMRFIAVDGPRWMLRGVIVGAAAGNNPAANEAIEGLFRELVVVRGEAPMAPGDMLPMRVPAALQGGETPEGE
ncbi:MAG: DUF3710 domain-containing protein [Microbacteriaceae bacterium]|nr:DUF3710 domain-containing protein [Microbacteriaceae bacterium]